MCESGNAPLQRGKDIVGLQLSFFIAGAKAVLSNLWKVDDASAAFFMKKMYASLVGGESPAASVRSAKLAMIRSRFSHPRYWAPSVVQGDSSTPIFRFPLD
jgi:CHAT domain-containing protein